MLNDENTQANPGMFAALSALTAINADLFTRPIQEGHRPIIPEPSRVYIGMSGQPIASALTTTLTEQPSERAAALFDFHHQRLYRLARRLTSSTDDALDLVQETFLRAARSPKSVPYGIEREEAWLVRVLVNLRRDQWRKATVRNRHDEPRPQFDVQPDHGSAVIARATIWRALEVLPPRRRAVIVMHELDGLAVSVIASQLGISAITVRWHLSAGRRQLTRFLTSPHGAGS